MLWGILVLLGHILTACDGHESIFLLIVIRGADDATHKVSTSKVRHSSGIALSEFRFKVRALPGLLDSASPHLIFYIVSDDYFSFLAHQLLFEVRFEVSHDHLALAH